MLRIALILLLLTTHVHVDLLTSEQPQLRLSDVHRIMNTVFTKHIRYKELSPTLMQRAITRFIDEFDPDHSYLLATEVSPFLHLSPERLQGILIEYKDNNYQIFKEMLLQFQSAIFRSR